MKKKELKCDSSLGNILSFIFNERTGSLSGTASIVKYEENKILIILDSENIEHQPIIKVANQFLESKDFNFLKEEENILAFGTLSIIVNPDNLVFIHSERIKTGEMKDFKFYKSSDYNIVLWSIINANFDFELNKEKIEILKEIKLC